MADTAPKVSADAKADDLPESSTPQGRGASQKWIQRKWRGLDNWRCNIGECIWDSFHEADMPKHYDAVHGPNAAVVPGPVPAPAPPIR